MEVVFCLQDSKTYKILNKYIHSDILGHIFELMFGKEYILLYSKQIGNIQKAFLYSKFYFVEGIEYYIKYINDTQISRSILLGSASSGNIELTLKLRFCGFVNPENITDALNFALENGHLEYIKHIMYLEKIPDTPLSIYKWLKYCENKKVKDEKIIIK